ncbi:hypothetical protein [Bifidobacterium criceti]|uniref:SPOR domain-containing protein n=1 Tax=Bifidobacterium criceti TaxID=1960969 RepID=A0A2A2ED02_9BIFI|nr:hypothetical protein [Bifidobacterium criceti]PAU67104.1 hypothetical protein B1526_1604 [Bifidobacterium criceti]
MSEPQQWYYNTATGQVELGPQSPMEHRIGPYPTRQAAMDALKTAAERNKKWDDEDRAWSDWGSSK